MPARKVSPYKPKKSPGAAVARVAKVGAGARTTVRNRTPPVGLKGQGNNPYAISNRAEPGRERGEVERLKAKIKELEEEKEGLRRNRKKVLRDTSTMHDTLLDAAESIMVAEGYPAVTTRRIAREVGVAPGLVHYYFPSTDELLLAAFRRKKEYHERGVRAALASQNPLHALWAFYNDPVRTALGVEFMAMASHRKAFRSELANDIEQSRRSQQEGLDKFFRQIGIDTSLVDPLCIAMIVAGMGRALVNEQIMGTTYGHAETKTFLERLMLQVQNNTFPVKDRA